MTNDPLYDYEMHEYRQYQELKKLPKCSVCHEHIQDEEAYCIHDCWVCNECMSDFKRDVLPEEF